MSSVTIGDQKFVILTVIGDCLAECADLVLVGHLCGLAVGGPLINHADLRVELGAVLVPIPTPQLSLVLHLPDYVMR